MASVLLVFLMATMAVTTASGYTSSSGKQLPPYPTTDTSPSNEKVPKFDEILGRDICKGAKEAVIKARDKCCNDLGNRGKCICPEVRSLVDSITFVQGLCSDYNACSGSWNYGAQMDTALVREYKCKLQDKENKAGECNEAVKKLKEMHKDCFHILAFPQGY